MRAKTQPANSRNRALGFDVHPADQVATNAAAFCIGACAMWITDIMLELLLR
jgi:hypothetical protein